MSTSKALKICENACTSIREAVLTGIRKALQKLNYNNSIPNIAFPCSKHEAIDLHPATISTSGSELLTCTKHPASACNELTEQHRLWFGKKAHTGIVVTNISLAANNCMSLDIHLKGSFLADESTEKLHHLAI